MTEPQEEIRGHKLLPKELLEKIPALYETDGMLAEKRKVPIKFFDACSGWTWYGLEFCPEQELFFGYVVGFEKEFGYFTLDEIATTKNRMGIPLERDCWWDTETTLADVLEHHKDISVLDMNKESGIEIWIRSKIEPERRPEKIDKSDASNSSWFLMKKYQERYGPDWKVWRGKASDEPGRNEK